ncbi:phosphoribosylformylglycinamidine synthase subunit PurS [Candidatus Micrarchaeota archaeon]|nr:phosphoribosylformylglycinamidine synthase subunit PurS [Candidatus Micrarchaeota archaeon]
MTEKEFVAEVTIEYKPSLSDPEGATIANDLMKRNGFEHVDRVRTAKLLRIHLKAANKDKAKSMVDKMCRELRLANPVSQDYSVSIA